MLTRLRFWAAVAGVCAASAPAFAFHPHPGLHHKQRVPVQVVPVQGQVTTQAVTTQLVTTQAVLVPQVTTQLVTVPQVTTQAFPATAQLSPLDLSTLIGSGVSAVTAAQLRGIREDLANLQTDVAAIKQSAASIDANIKAFVGKTPGGKADPTPTPKKDTKKEGKKPPQDIPPALLNTAPAPKPASDPAIKDLAAAVGRLADEVKQNNAAVQELIKKRK